MRQQFYYLLPIILFYSSFIIIMLVFLNSFSSELFFQIIKIYFRLKFDRILYFHRKYVRIQRFKSIVYFIITRYNTFAYNIVIYFYITF